MVKMLYQPSQDRFQVDQMYFDQNRTPCLSLINLQGKTNKKPVKKYEKLSPATNFTTFSCVLSNKHTNSNINLKQKEVFC